MHTFSHDPQNSDSEFRPLLQKAINSVPKVNSVSSGKRMTTDIIFHPFIGLSRSLHCHPQEIISLPDIKLTLGICQSHLKHYRVTDYIGAVFKHSACQKSAYVSSEEIIIELLVQPTFDPADIGFRRKSLR